MKIAGSLVLVTGGGSGIGRFLAERLETESAEVCVLEVDAARCTELCEASGGRIKARVCDVTDPAAVDAAAIFRKSCVDTYALNGGVLRCIWIKV
jgi:NAD(P)-dependent dehydrogenase (short-subunit alcohol dehydrogenase family)